MTDISRRSMCKGTLGSMLTFTLLESLFQHDAFGDEVKPLINKWVSDLDALGRDVKGQNISQILWQQKVEELFARVELNELLRLVDFDKLTKDIKIPDQGAKSLGFRFPEVEGIPKQLVFGKQIFALKKGRSVVPHGHNNMATAFLIVQGDLHGRHYDRVEDEKQHIIIRPTIDRSFKPGEYSTVSDYKDNIHWFKANSEVAYIFNIHVNDTRPNSSTWSRSSSIRTNAQLTRSFRPALSAIARPVYR